ncbi:MAG: peptidylprolyl isomerase [Georgfuchsia sp.]
MNKMLLLSLALVISATTVLAAAPLKGSATGGQAAVSESTLIDFLMTDQSKMPDASKRKEVLQRELSAQNTILAEANKLGLASTSAVKVKQELARRQILVEAYWTDFFSKHPVSEASLHASYDKAKSAAGAKQYHLSQIVVKDEAAAQKAIDLLKQNKSFDEVAKSFVPAGAKSTTDLGWRWPNAIFPPVAKAIDSLKPGEYTTQPIQMAGGFAIVKLEEVRDQQFPAFEAVKSQVANGERQRMQAEELNRLKSVR